MAVDLKGCFGAVGALVGATAPPDPAFGADLVRLFSALVGFDHVVIFGYRGGERPIDLFSTFAPAAYEVFVALYQRGPFLLDPFYRAIADGVAGFRRMRDLAPDRFFSSEYFRSYYVQTGLAEEVGFFVPLGPGAGTGVVVSLMRERASGAFARRDVDLLAAAEPLVLSLARRQWGDLDRRFSHPAARTAGRRPGPPARPERVWDDLGLTAREAEIVQLVLQGHSSDSVAATLGISTGTVKVHRRNVYRKLNITSQVQLLSVYLDRVAEA